MNNGPSSARGAIQERKNNEPGEEYNQYVGGPHSRVSEPLCILVQIRRPLRIYVHFSLLLLSSSSFYLDPICDYPQLAPVILYLLFFIIPVAACGRVGNCCRFRESAEGKDEEFIRGFLFFFERNGTKLDWMIRKKRERRIIMNSLFIIQLRFYPLIMYVI